MASMGEWGRPGLWCRRGASNSLLCLLVLTAVVLATIRYSPSVMFFQETRSPLNCTNPDRKMPPDRALVKNCITSAVMGQADRDVMATQFPDRKEEYVVENNDRRVLAFHQMYEEELGSKSAGKVLPTAQAALVTLHAVIDQLKRKLDTRTIRILDVPCGDMTWMSHFLSIRDDVEYTGMDVVPEVIQKLKSQYKDKPWRFINQDIISEPLENSYDLVFSRLYIHQLHTGDVFRLFRKFADSRSKFLLTSYNPTLSQNEDLDEAYMVNRRYNPVNLEIPPYSLIPPYCMQLDFSKKVGREHNSYLALFKLPMRQFPKCDVKQINVTGAPDTMYSCFDWSKPLVLE